MHFMVPEEVNDLHVASPGSVLHGGDELHRGSIEIHFRMPQQLGDDLGMTLMAGPVNGSHSFPVGEIDIDPRDGEEVLDDGHVATVRGPNQESAALGVLPVDVEVGMSAASFDLVAASIFDGFKDNGVVK